MLLVLGIACSLLAGLVLTFAVRGAARRAKIVAEPRNDRWHRGHTALLGGIAIYMAFITGCLVFSRQTSKAYPVLVAGTLLFIVGLIDDLRPIKPYAKLILQLIAAAVVVYFGLRLPWTASDAINNLITVFWLVGITNAINLLDNMDGLAGGISVIACAFLTISFLMNGQTAEAMLPAMLAGAALGFLVFNFNPASIFMGDCGSMFLGFSLGGLALLSDFGRLRNLSAVLLSPVLILLIPIFDTCVVTVTRKLSGRAISQGGRDHTSHRLVALGMSERRAVLMLYLFAASSGVLALVLRLLESVMLWLLVPGFALVLLFMGLYLGKVRIYEAGEPPAGSYIIRLIADFSFKRRVFEVLLDVVLAALAYYGAYLLRFDGNPPAEQIIIFADTLVLVAVIEILLLLAGGVYRGLWRYTGMDDLVNIGKSVFIGGVTSALTVLFIYNMQGPSRTVFVLNALLLFVFISASRLSFRVLGVLIRSQRNRAHPDARYVLIYGAGDGGELLIREILNNPDHGCAPVGFIDDDARKAGKKIHGYRIFNSSELPDLIRRHGVDEVLISSAKVSENKLDELRGLGLHLRRMSIRIESISDA
jgi:UDP-GlcNAc:undecaprenyl-phosphate GlcNAc-1-phosphate transferase